MKFTELLTPDNIRQGVVSSSKKALLEFIGRIVGKQVDLERFSSLKCFESLFGREKMGCTAIGNGVAMPRARLPAGDKPIAVFLQLAEPVDYDAPDKRKVDLILAVLVPEDMCASYSANLSELSEKLTDKSLTKKLRAAQSAEDIWQVFKFADVYLDEGGKEEAAVTNN
ncbi:PTS IIA-like nitrogen-regulatory protein PtsN [Actinobacillus succinogenes]|uniref:PTS IIA-like nitrogen-regulatory protein PtsN n=1 Tax=Actinobacillus succinogenes (strain ATCC 55618 / DSM 22257 / CCUG 43843 / 130Z) TaxID=339671 RepID=A6VMV0_ACTSZ|nr:PTS IIA-like nitrogen regulatory protein PtsN [Actinobacillus succinogenes]ABR74297.1 PTS IIA-like nitrogen-regulatory protein PtsN [Actinobacillus succinogenes 130Z]PHI39278.1 PTS IIA-like nitrogen-regulatory protein PtsN [Actinobacillus succinogenes]